MSEPKTDTPETDAKVFEIEEHRGSTREIPTPDGTLVDASFARQLERQRDYFKRIAEQILQQTPVGYIPNHTVENLPGIVDGWVKEAAGESLRADVLERDLAALRAAADGLERAIQEMREEAGDSRGRSGEYIDSIPNEALARYAEVKGGAK